MDTCTLACVNLYVADLETPPVANTAVNGQNNDCCKWSYRISFLCEEGIRAAAAFVSHSLWNDECFIFGRAAFVTASFTAYTQGLC